MSAQEIVEGFTSALEAGDFETAATYLADNFQATAPQFPEPLGVQEWIGLAMGLRAAFPDLSYNFEILDVTDDGARVSTQITGTHNGDLDLSSRGMGVIPATGIAVSAVPETSDGRVQDGKVVSIHINQTPASGLASVLQQIGVDLPPM